MSRPTPVAERILVIEDNKTNRELMIYLLNAFGYPTAEADNGRLGLEMARAIRPQLVVCDVQVPELDGYGVIREIKLDANLRGIPVVAVTALAMVGDRDRILAAGFDGYIPKPISPETFVGELEKFLSAEKRVAVRNAVVTSTPIVAAVVQSSASESRGTVVVVDDVPENLELALNIFQPLGYTVLTTDNAESALALMRQKRPNFVLCDLHMEPQNGLDLLDRAKADPVLKHIPVIIISATSTGPHHAAECFQHGAAQFVRRPIEPETLLAEIDHVISRQAISDD